MTRSRRHPHLLLDAGGTLVCPNADLLTEVSRERGHDVHPGDFIAGFFHRIHRLDRSLRDGANQPMIADFLLDVALLAGVGPGDAEWVIEEAKRRSSPRTLWTYALPGAEQAVAELHAAGFAMSVVSNSDGSVGQQMADLGLAKYFDHVFDSAHLGVSKPDPRFLEHVLRTLELTSADCLLVGDVVMVDGACAKRCGMRAVHLDPLSLYCEWSGLRTTDLRAFTRMLIDGALDLDDARFLSLA
jgi:putative hydrolase of the HAD superfamily